MLQFDGGQAATTNNWPADPTVPPDICALGPTHQGTGVLLSSFNALIDLDLFYRDGAAPRGIRHTIIQGLGPISQVFPGAIGFRAKSHALGLPAQVNAQVWETVDGPLPLSPLLNLATLSPAGIITPPTANLNGITGKVAGNGAVIAGSGFAVNRTQPGVYIVTFNTALSAIPIVLVTAQSQAQFVLNINGQLPTSTTQFEVVSTQAATGTLTDCAFDFVALVPQ